MILWVFSLLLLLALAVVLAPRRTADGRLSVAAWWACWLATTLVVPVVAFAIGLAHYDSAVCGTNTSGDCDLGALEGIVWAVAALALCLLAWAADAVRRRIRRRVTSALPRDGRDCRWPPPC